VFPKLVFAIRDGLNHKFGDPNYDIKQLALECASKRMYPDILNYDQVVKVTGSFKTPMGCRSFLGVYEDENGEQIHDGRNNLGVISLNLPRIALEAKGNEAEFWKLLDERLQLARKALMTRIARLEGVKARVAPILYMEGACGVRLKADDDVSRSSKTAARRFRWAISAFTRPSTPCLATRICTTAKRCVRKASPSFSACATR
jgi:ribonucleoside-triphosphate reductase